MPSKQEIRDDAAFRSMLHRALVIWERANVILEDEMADGTSIREIRIQGPNVTGGGFRAIIKGSVGGQAIVAFHNAETVQELMAGVVERANSDGMRWKEDAPYVPNQPKYKRAGDEA